ncbi:hypothetical protein F01_570034 [Burkholderia cenocepacia]|nr:hypothetical protein F01_570034 [Burkholderia cenocepacia]
MCPRTKGNHGQAGGRAVSLGKIGQLD